MKLYRWDGHIVGHHEPATLDDLRAALAEFGMVSVPVEPTQHQKYAIDSTDLNEFCTSARQSRQHEIGVQIYKAMIQAAQENTK